MNKIIQVNASIQLNNLHEVIYWPVDEQVNCSLKEFIFNTFLGRCDIGSRNLRLLSSLNMGWWTNEHACVLEWNELCCA
jgi:hypothetical protein